LREELAARAEREATNRFNGLYTASVKRDQSDADTNTKTQRDMIADDYINLVMSGDVEAAEEKYAELEEISRFRSDAAYIGDTPAETESYLRGVRGAAKAASLARELEDLSGAREISDEKRKEIEDVLKDPDISPKARQQLYAATNGRLKGIDARAFADRVASDNYEAKVVRAESGGRADAKNGLSSATGHHQFTAGTWAGLVKKYQPEWAQGLSPEQVQALRKDPAKSSEMFQHFRRENQGALKMAGLPVNDATEYLMHFFGIGDGPRVIGADPSKLVSDIVSAGKIKANPFLQGMTVADVMNWSARKMTVKGSDLAAMRSQFDQIEDTEVRNLAITAFNQHYQSRVQQENAASTEYETRLSQKDDTLTEQEVLSDHSLSDAAQQEIIGEMRKQAGLTKAIQDTMFRLSDPSARIDKYDSSDRNKVDDVYKLELGDEDPMSRTGMATAAKYVGRTGFLPKTAMNSIRGSLQGDDPAAISESMEFLSMVLDRDPSAVSVHSGHAEVENALSDYSLMTQYMTGEEAAAKMIERRDNPPSRNLGEQGKKISRALTSKDIVNHFSDLGKDIEFRSDMQEALVTGDYQEMFLREYEATGDEDLAKYRALNQISKIWGPNTVSGGKHIMRYPPQDFYPSDANDPDWMRNQLVREVNDYAAPETKSFAHSLAEGLALSELEYNGVTSDNIFLMSDEFTRREVNTKQSPSYKVMFKDADGVLQQMPKRFYFQKPVGVTQDEFEASHAAEREKNNVRMWRSWMRENTAKSDAEVIEELEANLDQYKLTPPPEN
jgi:hypothetical protein